MKSWESPKMTIYNIRMNENIAASNDESNNYERVYIYYDLGGITRGGADYWCSGTAIQDTSISYTPGEWQNTVNNSHLNTISGCLA